MRHVVVHQASVTPLRMLTQVGLAGSSLSEFVLFSGVGEGDVARAGTASTGVHLHTPETCRGHVTPHVTVHHASVTP